MGTIQRNSRMGIMSPLWLVLGILFGIAAAIEAKKKGRSEIGWFLGSLALGPFGLLYVLLLPSIVPGSSAPSEDQRQRMIRAEEDRATERFKKGKAL